MVGAHYFNKKRSGYMIQAQDVQAGHHNLEGWQITHDLLLQCRRLVQKALPIPLKTSAEFKFRTSSKYKMGGYKTVQNDSYEQNWYDTKYKSLAKR